MILMQRPPTPPVMLAMHSPPHYPLCTRKSSKAVLVSQASLVFLGIAADLVDRDRGFVFRGLGFKFRV